MRTDKLRQHALLCLDRLKLIVEHAQHLSDMEIISMVGDVNEVYGRYVQMPEYNEEQPHTTREETVDLHIICMEILKRRR